MEIRQRKSLNYSSNDDNQFKNQYNNNYQPLNNRIAASPVIYQNGFDGTNVYSSNDITTRNINKSINTNIKPRVPRGPPRTSIIEELQSPNQTIDSLHKNSLDTINKTTDLKTSIINKSIFESTKSNLINNRRETLLDDNDDDPIVRRRPLVNTNDGIVNKAIDSNQFDNANQLNSSNRLYNAQDNLLYNWIVVSGFIKSSNSLNEVISRFQPYGQIIEHQDGLGNWIFIRYDNVLHVNKAINSENNQLFNYQSILSVIQLNDDIAKRLSFNSNTINNQSSIRSTETSRIGEISQMYRSHLLVDNTSTVISNHKSVSKSFEQILQPPKSRKSSICKKIIDFFLSF